MILCPNCETPQAEPGECTACGASTVLSGRWVIEGFIGQGGQGRTFLGADLQSAQRVAIKELSVAQARDWKAVELFRRSAQILEQLDHPGMPRVLDNFELQRQGVSFFYVVQEFIEGESLQAGLDRGETMLADELVAVANEMLEILEYLHGRQPPIIHRDIKPANIMRRPDSSLVLIDFGLVRDTSVRGGGSTMMMGTPGYAPIEQFMGKAEPATDIYALGATLIALSSGEDPDSLLSRTTATLEFREHIDLREPMCQLLEDMTQPDIALRLPDAQAVRARLAEAFTPPSRTWAALTRTPDFVPRAERLLTAGQQGVIMRGARHQVGSRWLIWAPAILGFQALGFVAPLIEAGALGLAALGLVALLYLVLLIAPWKQVSLGQSEALVNLDGRTMLLGPGNVGTGALLRRRVSLGLWRLETMFYRVLDRGAYAYDMCVVLHLRPVHASELEELKRSKGKGDRRIHVESAPYLKLKDKKLLEALREAVVGAVDRHQLASYAGKTGHPDSDRDWSAEVRLYGHLPQPPTWIVTGDDPRLARMRSSLLDLGLELELMRITPSPWRGEHTLDGAPLFVEPINPRDDRHFLDRQLYLLLSEEPHHGEEAA